MGVPPLRRPGLDHPLPFACRALVSHTDRGVPRWPPWGSPPPFPACRALGAHAARGVSPLLPPLPPVLGGSPPLSWVYDALGAHAAVGGVPPFFRAWPTRRGRAWFVPCPLLPACGLRVLLGLGGPFLVLGPVAQGGPVLVRSGVPHCTPSARRGRALLVAPPPSPFPPSAAARIRRGRPFGGAPCRQVNLSVFG